MQAQHHLCREFDKVDLQDLGYEREAPGSAQVAFDDLDLIVFGQELDVERAADAQGIGNLAGDLLDPPDRFHIELLRRELDGRITGMNAGIFDMFRDGIGQDLSFIGDGIELDLLASLHELADHDRMLLGYFCC